MNPDPHDALRPLAEAYALGTLEEGERRAFQAHLGSGCAECAVAAGAAAALLPALARAGGGVAPGTDLRRQILDLAGAPTPPIDPASYRWEEVAPGIRLSVMAEDPGRGMRACLAWADPGATHAVHRHEGDELILVLEGGLRDHRGEYGPGDLCRSRAGSVHVEEVLDRGTCFCYVVYYGGLAYLSS